MADFTKKYYTTKKFKITFFNLKTTFTKYFTNPMEKYKYTLS